MTNPSVLFNLPELLNIIGDADNEIFEDNLLLINDAYQVLELEFQSTGDSLVRMDKPRNRSFFPSQVIMAIVSTQKGRQAFISNRGIHFLCEINVSRISFSFQTSCPRFSAFYCFFSSSMKTSQTQFQFLRNELDLGLGAV